MIEEVDRAATCLNCRHWSGDKSAARRRVQEFGADAMSEERGMAEVGACSEGHRLDLEVVCGRYCMGGYAVFATPAWFGCVMFERHGAAEEGASS